MPRRGSARTTTRRPTSTASAGPFDQWPSGMGFEYFYGFMGGETDQWTPYLFRNHTQIFPWVGKPGYNLTTDMADEAINYMKRAECRRAGQAVLPLLRARRHARAAPADAGMDRQVQGQVRHGLERPARADLRQPEAARRDPGEHPAHALAGRACRNGIRSLPMRRSCSPARRRSSPPTWPIPTTRSAGSSRRWRTWASSTTR